MTKAETARKEAYARIGSPYVFGTWGRECTVTVRKQYAGYNPEHKKKIYAACPRLSGKADSCRGCRFEGMLCYDCRGFTHWCLLQAGIDIKGGGATIQYGTAENWAARGRIADGMPDCVCCVFQQKGDRMIHTGLHVGGGVIIHCSSTGSGTARTDSTGNTKWTHWAVPRGLYEEGDEHMTLLQKGSKGAAVKTLQEQLRELGHYSNKVDGDYGTKTAAAVKAFQQANGLTADGIAGEATQIALARAVAQKHGTGEAALPSSVLADMLLAVRGELAAARQHIDAVDQRLGEIIGNA